MQSSSASKDSSSQRMRSHFYSKIETLADIRVMLGTPVQPFSAEIHLVTTQIRRIVT